MAQDHFTEARLAAIANTLPPNARQLVQVGAGDGALVHKYRNSYPSTALVVVEGHPAMAQRATSYAERVIQARIDAVGVDFFRHLQWADCWLFDGTLEQLLSPAQVLANIRASIQFDASVVACVSNPAFAPISFQHGWDYGALEVLFAEAGFRFASGIGLGLRAASPDKAAPISHFLLKAIPA